MKNIYISSYTVNNSIQTKGNDEIWENTGRPKIHRHTDVIKYNGHTSYTWLPQTNSTRQYLGVSPYMTTIISTRHYANYSEDERNATTERGNDTSEAKYPIRIINSTITTLLEVHGNVNTVFFPRHDANYSKVDEANVTRITGDEASRNEYQIDEIQSIGRSLLLGSSRISR